MKWSNLWSVAVMVATIFVAVPTASAQSDKLARAREHFDRGQAFFRQARYDDALNELMKAYVLDPNPLLVYNLARVHEERGDLENAVKFFDNYLRMAPRARNRRAVKRKLRDLRDELRSRPRQGVLEVRSTPPGALVRANGRVLGQTPLTGMRLSAGSYKLEVSADRHETWSRDVMVSPSRTTALDIKLVDQPSTVIVTTTPPGARATILSPKPRALGVCPCVVELPAGTYRLRVEHPGHQPRELDFVKQSGEQVKLPVTLVAAHARGVLLVEANVAGAQINVDGQPVGTVPMPRPVDVMSGTITVEVVAAGHQTFRRQVTVAPTGITTVRAHLNPATMMVPVNPVTAPTPLPTPLIQEASSGQRTAGWVLTGIGIGATVAAGLTLTFALLNKRQFDSGEYFKNNQPPSAGTLLRQDITHVEAQALEDEANTLMTATYGLAGGGVALLVTGISLVATAGDDTPSPMVGVSPLPNGGLVTVGGGF